MSPGFQAAVAKLQSPVKELIGLVTQNGQNHVGVTLDDQREVVNWIEKSNEIVADGKMRELDDVLRPKTYIATNYFTAADVALYGALYPTLSQLQPIQYYSTPSITRYFDHIQNQKFVRAAAAPLAPIFQVVHFDFDNAPAVERRADLPKKKEKATRQEPAPEPTQEGTTTLAPTSSSTAAPQGPQGGVRKKEKKEEKEKKKDVEDDANKKNKGGKAVPVTEDAGEPVPSMIDLRVGHIVDIFKHPDADGLYVEKIDIGEETGPRTVVSGLVNYIPIEEMRDKYLVVVCNLKPANMRGIKSFAMVLCATSKEGKGGGIELIQPPPGSKPGERIYFEGAEFESATPISQLNPKKKIFETIQPGFTTLESREAAWINPAGQSIHRIRTKDGVCVAPTLVSASLS